jgi:protein-S-isoprenylcysteine O-methyltransferase Ste14
MRYDGDSSKRGCRREGGLALPNTQPTGRPGDERGAAVRFPFPPALFIVPLALSLALHRRRPWRMPGQPVTTVVGGVLVAAGMALSFSAAATVVAHRSTVVPHHPVATLVTTGPFRVSRNPMYTGLATAYLGAALWAGTWWPLPLTPLCLLATDRLVIRPEEAYLAGRFGVAYARYRTRVRRWL